MIKNDYGIRLEIGLLIPCNVIVYEIDGGETAVSIADPHAVLALSDEPALQEMADVAKEKLIRVLIPFLSLQF